MMMAAQAELMKKLSGDRAAPPAAAPPSAPAAAAASNTLPATGRQPASDAVLASAQSVAAALESGRLVLRAVRFSPDGASMTAPADASIRSIADAMKTIGGLFAVEAHVPMNGASWSTARSVSSRQAQAFRNAIVSAGALGTSVAAVGYGAGRPEKENDDSPRIEIVRLR
jgi:outer membrane protein OmpA-like peptidoglycan-associated protein